MNKDITGHHGFARAQDGMNRQGDKTGNRKGPGWVLSAVCWYLLWLYVMVDGFIPLQISP